MSEQPADNLKIALKKRLEREGRWSAVEPTRDAMMRECRSKGMSKEDAQAWTYGELDRLYPPLPPVECSQGDSTALADCGQSDDDVSPARPREGQLQGLGDIPADWPELPANASLAAEIAWVQANRLLMVEEQTSGATRVRLDKARAPAPSWAALGWLETSIRSYAKYVEVAAKATATAQDEQDQVRRERMALEEIRGLLAEML